MHETNFTIEAPDGQAVAVYRWSGAGSGSGSPTAVVQIAHGASEHAARYRRVADALVDAGYEVYAQDHRGHGRTAAEHGRFGVARPGGWGAIVEDTHRLTGHVASEHPGTPIVLLGHSMGSMIAQGYLQRWGDDLSALVLSGTTGGLGLDQDTLDMVVALGEGEGADEPSEVFAAMFAGFNEPFGGPDATGFEWLSRDPDEVQAYVEDPWCGEPLSNGFVADMLTGTSAMWTPEAEERIRRDLPVYVFGGVDDPVGGEQAASVRELVERYEALGAGPVTLRLYPGARHETLNETDRTEVTADLIAWLDSTVGGGS